MKAAIRNEIARRVLARPCGCAAETAWRRPLGGFASAADPLFGKLRSVVSPTHAMPTDLLAEAATFDRHRCYEVLLANAARLDLHAEA